ncbi:hypothetical protein [Saccharibacillus endophyticus]|uniref:hypothetical protein n=1 Tax=Saccharibacillus endophyticus TaxID=2060666 RepID=UPI0015572196|nr:hypothetical protein [Saccharibacillus endophyticus]
MGNRSPGSRRPIKASEKKVGGLILALFLLLVPTACGAWQSGPQNETEPIRQQEADSHDNVSKQPGSNSDDFITVEVIVESDRDSASGFKTEINARKNPQSASYDTIELPYRETFEVSKDAFIPLPSVRLQADAADDAEWISCTILYDGEEVATHLSRGDGAQAVCEKKFRLGPG